MHIPVVPALLGLAFVHSAKVYAAATIGVYPGYNCDPRQAVEVDITADAGITTIPVSGAAGLVSIDQGCTVWLCFAGQSCNDPSGNSLMHVLPQDVCLLSFDGHLPMVWDQVFVSCS